MDFVDYSSSRMMHAQEAEMYMRIYQYAAEDFRAVSDCVKSHNTIDAFVTGLENTVITALNSHTHGNGNNGSPTTGPMTSFRLAVKPVAPFSSTGVPENMGGNIVRPAGKLSYIDARITSPSNSIVTYKRRALEIPAAMGGIIPIGIRH